MAAISDSIVHLTMRFEETMLSIGTGFIYKHDSEYFIVTAWHNLTGLHSETLEPLSKKLSIPNNVVANIAIIHPGFGVSRMPIVIPLNDEERSFFYVHPNNWPRIDVAIIPFDPTSTFLSGFYLPSDTGKEKGVYLSPIMQVQGSGTTEISPVQNHLVPDSDIIKKWFESVDVTEELFIPGYPYNIQDYYTQPVWKRATVASSVQQGWNREPKFLIDSASKSGMSGSPVFYYSSSGTVKIRSSKYYFSNGIAILAGVYVGRMGIEGENDPQIGTVWNQSVINEIVEAKCFENHPYEIKISYDDLLESMQTILATCSCKGLNNIKNPDLPSRYYTRQRLMDKIKGRASPNRALEAVLEAAENYKGDLVVDQD